MTERQKNNVTIVLKITEELSAEIERVREHYEKLIPGKRISRCDAVRILVTLGLQKFRQLEP